MYTHTESKSLEEKDFDAVDCTSLVQDSLESMIMPIGMGVNLFEKSASLRWCK